ncbi:MAG: aminopeptidase P N-terminal domain-containing protein [Planctomycetota bacterium]
MLKHIVERRARVAAAWKLSDEVVLIGAGEPQLIPGSGDQFFSFRAHAEYYYLVGDDCAGGVVAYDPQTGWANFVPDVTERERIWEGREQPAGESLNVLAAWLAARRGRTLCVLGAELPLSRHDAARSQALRDVLTHTRRPKDAAELAGIRRAVVATHAGFEVARKMIRPGITEREIQIELEAEFLRRGATRVAYDTIVGAGPNSAVFHVTPSRRQVAPGDLVLIDAAAECDRYVCDVTRTFPAGGEFAPVQRDLYEIVLGVEERAIARSTAGTEYSDIHMKACLEITAGLIEMGLLRGGAESLVEQEAHTLFFPHGIGHMVGLGVRDASGLAPGRTRRTTGPLKLLRTDMPLEPGYVLTIEPGIYFIPALLNDPARRQRYHEVVDWRQVDSLLGIGGIRIEDNVLVTAAQPEVLTASIPKKY